MCQAFHRHRPFGMAEPGDDHRLGRAERSWLGAVRGRCPVSTFALIVSALPGWRVGRRMTRAWSAIREGVPVHRSGQRPLHRRCDRPRPGARAIVRAFRRQLDVARGERQQAGLRRSDADLRAAHGTAGHDAATMVTVECHWSCSGVVGAGGSRRRQVAAAAAVADGSDASPATCERARRGHRRRARPRAADSVVAASIHQRDWWGPRRGGRGAALERDS